MRRTLFIALILSIAPAYADTGGIIGSRLGAISDQLQAPVSIPVVSVVNDGIRPDDTESVDTSWLTAEQKKERETGIAPKAYKPNKARHVGRTFRRSLAVMGAGASRFATAYSKMNMQRPIYMAPYQAPLQPLSNYMVTPPLPMMHGYSVNGVGSTITVQQLY